MKILYFSQFYTPESIAPSFRATEHSKIWSKMGHDVTVFTGYPNYPSGRIFEGYIPKLMSKESIDGVNVIRSKLVAVPNTSVIKRLENALSYFFFGLFNIIFNKRKIGKEFDVVLGTSGVVFNALLAQIYSFFYRIPFIFEIRDITYVQMQATGKRKDSLAVKGMKMLELFLCKKASKIVVVTNGFKKSLILDGVQEEKIEVITNGVDVKPLKNVPNSREKFVLSYFGTLGISQDIVNTFAYGKVIADLTDDFEYLIIGEGAQRKEAEEQSEKSENFFIHLLPGMSAENLEPYYCHTQMSVITLRKSENFKHTIPSKLFQIMGRGIAVLFIGPDGEAADIIRKYHAGIVLTDSTEEDLVKLKNFFADNGWKDEVNQMGRNGRKAVEEHYLRTALAKRYIDVMDSVRSK
ncbi:MAG: glycosyltransferase family 4 protein [Hungatella sp.]|nr:glycosyltransferase family 4 protein [Hungatella sp.]